MDRFIEENFQLVRKNQAGLKSNMDRFIEPLFLILIILTFCLKSNMDRFIGKIVVDNPPFRIV